MIFGLTVCVCFLFGSCSSPLTPAPITEPVKAFSSEIKGESGDFSFEGTLKVSSVQDISLTFLSPAGLNGFKIKLGEDGFYSDVMGVEDFTPTEELNDDSLIKLLLLSVRQAVFCQRDFTRNGDNTLRSVFTQCGQTVTATYDETGVLTGISCRLLSMTKK